MESFEQVARLDYDHLVEVIPITQTNRHGELTFTVTSIESYRDGFIVLFLVEHMGDDLLDLKYLECVNERGQHYRGRMISGFGGGGRPGGGYHLRSAHTFAPPLNPEARQLTFTTVDAKWVTFDRSANSPGPSRPTAERSAGPWTFSIALGERDG
jgi:hypothetical protein